MTFCFVYVKISLFLQNRTIVFDYEMILFKASHSGEEAWGLGAHASPILRIFLNPPTKTDAPHGAPPTPPHLKMKPPPSEKQPLPIET